MHRSFELQITFSSGLVRLQRARSGLVTRWQHVSSCLIIGAGALVPVLENSQGAIVLVILKGGRGGGSAPAK